MEVIAILGGTGPEGFGLAVRWTMAGKEVAIGSRSRERAAEAAERIRTMVPASVVRAGTNEDVVSDSDYVIVALPYQGIEKTLGPIAPSLAGKVVVSVAAALEWENGHPRPLQVVEGSVAQKVQTLIPSATVTSGFHTLSAESLGNPDNKLDEDCIVCGDDRDSRHVTMDLARLIDGVRPVSGGRLENSIYPELLVGLLATINRIHKVRAGVRLVGLNT